MSAILAERGDLGKARYRPSDELSTLDDDGVAKGSPLGTDHPTGSPIIHSLSRIPTPADDPGPGETLS
jgi:hypothetical protein